MRLFWVFLGLAVLFAIPFLIWGEGFEQRFSQDGAVAWLLAYGRWAWAVAILLLVLDLFLPIPATAVMAALGFLYGPLAGGLIGGAGSILSGLFAYGLCRLAGPGAAVRILGERDYERGRRLSAGLGGWLVVLSRWLPIFPEAIACMAGLTRMPLHRFVVALACGSLPLGFVFAAVGDAGVERPVLAIALSALVPPVLWLVVQPAFRATAGLRRRNGGRT